MAPRKKPVEILEEKKIPETIKTFNMMSKIYMVNPYKKIAFVPGSITQDIVIDSWTQCQIDAGLLEKV